MILKNALIYTPENTFKKGDLAVNGSVISLSLLPGILKFLMPPASTPFPGSPISTFTAAWAMISVTPPKILLRP